MYQGVPYPFHQDWLVRFKAITTLDVKQQRVSRQSFPGRHRVFFFPAAIESSMLVIFFWQSILSISSNNVQVNPFHVKPQHLKQQQSATPSAIKACIWSYFRSKFRPTRFLCAAPFFFVGYIHLGTPLRDLMISFHSCQLSPPGRCNRFSPHANLFKDALVVSVIVSSL